MSKIDVTSKVDFGNPDDECMPLLQCVCGEKFEHWKFVISIYDDTPTECPKCGRKFYFANSVRVYEVMA